MKISLFYSLSLATSLVPLATAAAPTGPLAVRRELPQSGQETRFIRSRRDLSISVVKRTDSSPMMQAGPASDKKNGTMSMDDSHAMDKVKMHNIKNNTMQMGDAIMGMDEGKMDKMGGSKNASMDMGMDRSEDDKMKSSMADKMKDDKMKDDKMNADKLRMDNSSSDGMRMTMASGPGKDKGRMDTMMNHASTMAKGMGMAEASSTAPSTSTADAAVAATTSATDTSSVDSATTSAAMVDMVDMAMISASADSSSMSYDASSSDATSTSDAPAMDMSSSSSIQAPSTSYDASAAEAAMTSASYMANQAVASDSASYLASTSMDAALASSTASADYSSSSSSADYSASNAAASDYSSSNSSTDSASYTSSADASYSASATMAMDSGSATDAAAASYATSSSGSAPPPPPPASAPPASAANCQTSAGSAATDLLVLNFANTLEKLEASFYIQGLATFSQSDMEKAGLSSQQAQIVVESLTTIASDEATHSTALISTMSALGSTALEICEFDFTAALTDPVTFLATARALEFVGISAYAGGASLISSKSVLTAAAQILSIESRHQSILNILNAGSVIPQAFDMALTPQSVLALAGGFLSNCTASDLGLTSNAPLSIRNRNTGSTSFGSGDLLAFTSTVSSDASSIFCAMLIGGASQTINFPLEKCIIPDGIDGPVYVFLVSSETPLVADITVQDPSAIIAGPGLIFVESSSSLLQDLFTIQSSQKSKMKNGKNHKSMPSSDMGYVHIMVETNQVTGNHTEYWSRPEHRIAIEVDIQE